MSSANNQPSNDPLESAIAAMKNEAVGNDRPPAALVAATIETLRRLDVSASGTGAEPAAVEIARSSSSRYRRGILWAAALAAGVLLAILVRWPRTPTSGPVGDERHVGPIVAIEVNPAATFERLDNDLAKAQADAVALVDEAKKRQAEEQITRILADDSNLVAPAQTN